VKHPAAPLFRLPFDATDACRHALAAFHRARLDCVAPAVPQAGEDSEAAPEDWASPRDFVEAFVTYFTIRVQAQAADAGAFDPEYAQHVHEALACWEAAPTPADGSLPGAAEPARLKANRMHEVRP